MWKMTIQRGGLVHTECGRGGGGIERVEGAVWLVSAFGRRIAFFITAETASARRRKELLQSFVRFRKCHSTRISDLRASGFAGSFPHNW